MIDQEGILASCVAVNGSGRTDSQGLVGERRISKSVRNPPPVGRRPARNGIMIVGIAAVATLLLACSIDFGRSSSNDSPAVVAGDFAKIVFGHVNDSLQAPVLGAGVTVTTKYDSTVRKSLTTTTDNSGFYTVTFAAFDWYVNDIIQVEVTYDSLSAANSTVANSGPAQAVDVQFVEIIPEFSSAWTAALSTMVVVVAIVWNLRRVRS